MAERTWSGRSHGGNLGTALACAVARVGGRDLAYLFAIFPALWFWWRDRATRAALNDYWRTLRPGTRTWWRLPRHLWNFACTLADRVLVARAPDALRLTQTGQENVAVARRHPQGCILLSAHLGSFELAARWLAGQDQDGQSRLNLVMLDVEDPRVQAHLARAMGDRPYGVIDLRDPTNAALAIAGALSRGETCCMLGDRTAGAAAGTVTVDFLGRPARFPVGPFVVAAASGALVVPTFCCRRGWATWHCEADAPWAITLGRRADRQRDLTAAVQRWANRLAEQVRRHPWDWNNYFLFWN